MEFATLKQKAKAQIKGNVGILFLITLVSCALTSLASAVPVLSLVVSPALSLGMVAIYLKLTKGVKPEIKELFAHFNDFWPALKVMLLMGIKVFLWSLLLVIPGIVKSFAYAQAFYILAENPGMGARECLRRSEEMMKGHKMDYFLLGLSFIGWMMLVPFTAGILCIWLMPYMNATMANFYNAIKPAPARPAYAPGYGAAYTPGYIPAAPAAPTAPAAPAAGYAPSSAWYCPRCGEKNTANFCANCGTPRR